MQALRDLNRSGVSKRFACLAAAVLLLVGSAAADVAIAYSTAGPNAIAMASADTIDQSFFSPNFNFQGLGLVAQTYTAGITGTLTGINLHFSGPCSICGEGGNKPISINTVSGGMPTSTVLGSTLLAVSQGQIISFSTLITFPTAIPQVAGVQYAIVIDFGAAGGSNVTGEFNNTGYAAGGLFQSFDGGQTWSSNPEFDISFQTNVRGTTTQCDLLSANSVGWWPGDGDANDIAGGNNGTLVNGATFAPGIVGQGFSFDGVNDFVQVAQNAFDGLTDLTVDAWVKFDVLDSPDSDAQTIISALQSGVAHYWTLLKTDDNTLDLSFLTAEGNCNLNFVSQVFPFQTDRFYHIAATKAGGVVTLYVDGDEIISQTTSCTGAISANTGTTLIGAQDPISGSSVQRPLDGIIDELEIFNRALSASEVQDIFNSGSAGKCKNAQLTAAGPANIWLGLKNSDDVGTKFDLLAEVLKNGSLVVSGQLNGVPGGSSGFNNAILRTINLALPSPASIGPGDTLSIRLSVRIAVDVTGHRSGTARLWFNDSAANSRFGATLGGVAGDYFLTDGFTLGAGAGTGPRKTIDVFVDRAVNGNPFKPFGTWSKTF